MSVSRSKKKSSVTPAKAKKVADGWFSLYIRLRQTDFRGIASCVTCGIKRHWRDGDCGHFQLRGHLNTRWEPKNAHFQCGGCNGPRDGEQYKHSLYIDKVYGRGTALELEARARMVYKPGTLGMIEIAKEFQVKARIEAEKRKIDISYYEKEYKIPAI